LGRIAGAVVDSGIGGPVYCEFEQNARKIGQNAPLTNAGLTFTNFG